MAYQPPSRPGLAPAVQAVLATSLVLVLLAGVQLFILTDQTDRYFAWTIASPLTAAFLGAAYWGTIPAFLALWTQRGLRWQNARHGAAGVVVFGGFTLLATLVHVDKFHMDSVTGWVWLAVYLVVPVAGLVVAISQNRAQKGQPESPVAPMAGWARAASIVFGVVVLAFGAGLFAFPDGAGAAWPWGLTPLTARAIAVWLLGLGTVQSLAAQDGDWNNAQFLTATMFVLGFLQFAALARYPAEMTWGPGGWAYVAGLVFMTFMGAYGFAAARRANR
ncbi:MAG: hypothetical protein HYZ26_00255 [Chloroflexi bacterium]|nr:hypothetical protein [Chloroflexota bacterium]